MKHTGVLMPVASLPSPFFIGDFGPEAYRFADMIREAGYDIWQILPLNPLGYGYSPYQCLSSKALDESYISPEILKNEGLIRTVPEKVRVSTIDYQAAKQLKRKLLVEAFINFIPDRQYRRFTAQKWVIDYAIFITFKEYNENRCWVEWPDEYKNFPQNRNIQLLRKHEEIIELHKFIQYQLYHQFALLKKYLKKKRITVMGDMPFYVGIDSDDVYYNRQYFELYPDGRPHWIAGVPPDYFSATGQRWGNPLYDWKELRKHDYDFWFDRIHYSENLYDILRIDHFRAFDTYWKIDSKEETAINGEWIVNSGKDFFTKFFKKYPTSTIVAEDLGDLRPEVLELRDHFHLPGMRILEFNMYGESKEHELAYVGTHDNESLRTWYRSLNRNEKKVLDKFIRNKYPESDVLNGILKYAFNLKSNYIILSVVDILLDARRINLPGSVGSPNWEYKLKDFRALSRRLKTVNKKRMRDKK